jgi:DNA-binding protein H-NS
MKRDSKLTADITEEAHELLKEMCYKHERSKGWLLEKMIRKYCEPQEEVKKVTKSKITYPSNWQEQFEVLWAAKGKKGSKKNAREKFKRIVANSDNDTCLALTNALVNDIESRMDELGMAELHLTTYLNQERWEQ